MPDRDPYQYDEGGLFSEADSPKRENPYLRRSREKAAAKEAAHIEREARRAAKHSARPTAEGQAPAEPARPRRRKTFSDFMFEHVKLVTALITSLVILGLVVALPLVGVIGERIAEIQAERKDPLTLDYVERLTELDRLIVWQDLDQFHSYSTSTAKDSVTWRIRVEGTRYEVWISGVATDKPPTYVYLYDMASDGFMDLNKDDFDAFIEAYPPTK